MGIYFGVNHAIDSAVDEKLNSALETMTDTSAEPALDETGAETPTQTPGETDSSTSADPSQPKREPETVTVYVPTAETDKPETSTKPETQTETERETKPQIEWVYDEQLTEEVAELMEEKDLTSTSYFSLQGDRIERALALLEGFPEFAAYNNESFFMQQYDQPTASDIVSTWNFRWGLLSCGVAVFRAPGNWIAAVEVIF